MHKVGKNLEGQTIPHEAHNFDICIDDKKQFKT